MTENITVKLHGTDDLRLSVPITKVDKENRIVSGFATLNNVDRHGDMVDAEASAKAFERFRGNIREMHAPIAVGKMVSFEEKSYYDEETGKDYRGVFVQAYVSKGAENTWQKVLDKTLSGFSIGARVQHKDIVEKSDESGSKYRLIKDYELYELSLVDSPANQLANVMSITKMDDGSIELTGDAFEAETVEVEEVDETTEPTVLYKVLEKLSEISNKLGGNANMTTKETAVEETVETNETVEEETVEKAAEVSEVEDNNTEEAPALSDELVTELVNKVLERLSESDAETDAVEVDDTEAVEQVDVEATVNKAVVPVTESMQEIKELVEKGLEELKDRVEDLENSTAKKKSSELEGETVTKSDNFWGAAFTNSEFSVDSL